MKALTDKQAKALDALRNGGTVNDVCLAHRLKYDTASRVVRRLWRRGYLSFDSRGESGRRHYTLTESGRAAHLGSLK